VETYVKTFNGSIPSGMWIEGMGWDQNKWPVKEFPTAVCHDLLINFECPG
jgi:hypothetical protein